MQISSGPCWRRRRTVSSKAVASRAESIRAARGYDAVAEAFEFVMTGESDGDAVAAMAERKDENGATYSGMTVGTYMRIFLDLVGAEPLGEAGTLAASWRDNLKSELAV